MNMTPTCRNTQCPDNGIEKGSINLAENETVTCGACGELCELSPAPDTKPAGLGE